MGCLFLLGAIAVAVWPVYILDFKTPGAFAVEGSADFKLDLTQKMSENNCSFLLLRAGKPGENACSTAKIQVTPPGIAGLSGHDWTSIDTAACKIDALHWMEHFQPSLQFLGTLVPISTTYTDIAPRVGEYHVQSEEPLWALNQCDFPLYAYFPHSPLFLTFFVAAAVLGGIAILTCCCGLAVCCCCK